MVILVPMTEELTMLNVNAPIIMNGVIPKRNAFVPLLSNIHVQARVMPEEMEQLVTVNIRNASVRVVSHGMLLKGLVFVPVLIFAR